MPDKHVADLTKILNKVYNIQTPDVTWGHNDWDKHPEVEKRTLSFFDYAWTMQWEKESRWTPRPYFNLVTNEYNIESGEDRLTPENVGTGYSLDNSLKNNIVRGGNVALIVMKVSRPRAGEGHYQLRQMPLQMPQAQERYRTLLSAMLSLDCEAVRASEILSMRDFVMDEENPQ
tara:strand:+ start:331 stop:852 length:522 start_codon:yes stop_codon:yes gene_type:complete